ncbi:MAG TPA: tRNA (adenosine(37)-N6)-threonylcarbamoyltransferase complex transferase subunit TsaD [Bacteroidia bacterium]|nr:tRNA (adenosine(37)-N6)-threonylcarbamoyltransferase complex transferase subunit TsaD [Bacteroidia bacterium]
MNDGIMKILAIESSCDDTAAAVISNKLLLSNIIAGQQVHKDYGGVVPELASRAHQQNIVPVVDAALKKAGVKKEELDAIAFTRGPGLMGSLLVGTSFAKSMSLALNIPLIEVNHLQAHILAHFIQTPGEEYRCPSFPFLCLTVSGGHTQIVLVKSHLQMEIIGQTHDDAAGEAFDKAAKIMGLPYPGGPLVDKYSKRGNSIAFKFPTPHTTGFDFSFSGIKTSFLYLVRDEKLKDPDFVQKRQNDLCASFQRSIVTILIDKLKLAAASTGIKEIAIAGGVSANTGLRAALQQCGEELNWNIFIPKFEYCTDNAAMIAITGYYKYLAKEFADTDITPLAKYPI